MNPYTIYVYGQGKEKWEIGDYCVFDITLFGSGTEHAGVYLDALIAAEQKGWGAERIPFRLVHVTDQDSGRLIYAGGKSWIRNLIPRAVSVKERNAAYACLVFDTPLRVVSGNKLFQKLPFDMETARLPLVVKPVASGSSIGVSIAHTAEELRRSLTEGLALGGRTVLEEYIRGREIQVGILEDKALPSIEIIPKQGFYDYANKYQPGAALEVCPAEITPEEEARVRAAALRVYETLGLSVYSRADFILTEDGEPWFLEINTLPGMTPTSLLPQEAAAAGIDYNELCQRIVHASLEARKQGR